VANKFVDRMHKRNTQHANGYDKNRKGIKSKIKIMEAIVGVALTLLLFAVIFFGIFKLMTKDD
tara:strand:+ start:40 stop:228 length:189 start_codon:yes stop_codon:yes gene_type:complete